MLCAVTQDLSCPKEDVKGNIYTWNCDSGGNLDGKWKTDMWRDKNKLGYFYKLFSSSAYYATHIL